MNPPKQRGKRPYIWTRYGFYSLFFLSVGIGFIIWPVADLGFNSPRDIAAHVILIVVGILIAVVALANLYINRGYRP